MLRFKISWCSTVPILKMDSPQRAVDTKKQQLPALKQECPCAAFGVTNIGVTLVPSSPNAE